MWLLGHPLIAFHFPLCSFCDSAPFMGLGFSIIFFLFLWLYIMYVNRSQYCFPVPVRHCPCVVDYARRQEFIVLLVWENGVRANVATCSIVV